jgi:carbonic anhydrase
VGEIFTIRVAGNVSGTSETGTIEYGLGHLKTRLLVVMGHTKCGAVAAAASKAQLHGAVGELVSSIQPAVERAQRQHPSLDAAALTPHAIKENVWQSVFGLLKSDEIRELVAKQEVKVVGAVYDIASGKVEWLGEHPWQHELIASINARKQADTLAHAAPAQDQHAAASEDAHK